MITGVRSAVETASPAATGGSFDTTIVNPAVVLLPEYPVAEPTDTTPHPSFAAVTGPKSNTAPAALVAWSVWLCGTPRSVGAGRSNRASPEKYLPLSNRPSTRSVSSAVPLPHDATVVLSNSSVN